MEDQILADKWTDFQLRRNRWVRHNFPHDIGGEAIMNSLLGCIEELGELAHHHLKSKQNIRGDQDFHEKEKKDAIGDITVYLWGITNTIGDGSPFSANFWDKVKNFRRLLSTSDDYLIHAQLHLSRVGREILEEISGRISKGEKTTAVQKLIACLWDFCSWFAWDYHQIVEDTWNHVERRDWIKYPDTGLPPELVVDRAKP